MWWSGGLQTISEMFGNEEIFDLGSMILMSKNDVIDVLGVFGGVWGCSEIKGVEVLDRWEFCRQSPQ